MNYNDTAHAHAVTHIGSTQKYWYDANGNQTTRVIGADTFTLFYDAENRLYEVKKNNITIAQFTYDGDGRQVKSVVNGVTTLFVSAQYQEENSQPIKYYMAGAQTIAVRKNGTLSFILSDHLGSTSLITTSTGTPVSGTLYKPWGETRYTSGSMPTPYHFTGQREEASFGLYFYNARWYDPTLGRFAQADTIIPPGLHGLDRFAYVSNNPVRFTDPTGHMVACDYSCGSIGTFEDVYNTFKDSPFRDYYAVLSNAERSIHEYESNPTKDNYYIMESDKALARVLKLKAIGDVPSDEMTDAMYVYPEILGGGYVEAELDLGGDFGPGGSAVDTYATPILPMPYQTSTPTQISTPTQEPTPTRTPTPTPSRTYVPTLIPRRYGGELMAE